MILFTNSNEHKKNIIAQSFVGLGEVFESMGALFDSNPTPPYVVKEPERFVKAPSLEQNALKLAKKFASRLDEKRLEVGLKDNRT